MQYILTTIGLSSLTNGLRRELSAKEIYENSNKKESEIDKEFLNKFYKAYSELKEKLLTMQEKELQKLSAELNALLKYDRFNNQDIHKLLCTDTFLGQKAAELIEYYLQNKNLNVSIYNAKDLKTDEIENFHIALADLVKELSEELQGYKESGYEIIFNLTGGFKSVNSFLQTMASLYADKSLYIFESSQELLTIPRIPIKVDDEVIINNLQLFRALELGLKLPKAIESIPKTLVLEISGDYILSPWGEIVWQKVKSKFYREKLINPLQTKILYSQEFINDTNKLNPKELYQLNKSIDKLEKYIAFDENLRSLRYHELKGNIAKKYSHEFYPFDGNDSRRCYCNEKNGEIILEKLDAHLK